MDAQSTMAMKIRSPYRAPTARCKEFAEQPHSVCFRHPAIPSAEGNLLFILDGNDNAQGCLHHETARIVCAIIAGNRWDGYLSTSPNAEAINVPPDGLLTGEEYYFFVPRPIEALIDSSSPQPGGDTDPRTITLPTNPYHYPVVPAFREWMFPNGRLPGTWTTMAKRRSPGVASTSDAARSRDQCCRMTEAVEETDVAHIVPLAEEVWFNKNDMIRYGNKHASLRPGVNDDANTMLLRADLHRSFDKRRFTFLPKKQGVFVTHVLESESLRDTYHNVELNTNYIAPEYFFARFAWTVLPLLRPFLRRGQRRLLLIHGQPQWADPAEYLDFTDSSAKSRSASPKKSRSPSKRSWEEIGNEPGKQDYASQNPNDEPASDVARDSPDHHYAKRARRRSSSTPRQNIIAPLLQSHSALTPPQSCDCVPSPRSVLSSPFRDYYTNTDAEPNVYRKANVARNGERAVSHHCFGAGKPSDIQSHSSPLAQQDKGPWMTPCQLRAMASSHLLQERKRSDPNGLWQKQEAWLESVLKDGGALDRSEIARWSYVNGMELIQENHE